MWLNRDQVKQRYGVDPKGKIIATPQLRVNLAGVSFLELRGVEGRANAKDPLEGVFQRRRLGRYGAGGKQTY